MKKILLCLLVIKNLFSAAPVTHIYFAEKYLEKHPEINRKEFLVGTSFPDIRYSANIERTVTHEDNVTLDTVINTKDPFLAGMRFHVFIDIVREKFEEGYGIEKKIGNLYQNEKGTLRQRLTWLKFLEDDILWDKELATRVSGLFNSILPAQRMFGIKESVIQDWNDLLKNYCNGRPSDYLLYLEKNKKSFSNMTHEFMRGWGLACQTMYKSPIFTKYVDDMVKYILGLLD